MQVLTITEFFDKYGFIIYNFSIPSCLFDKPNLIVISVIIPLNNRSILLGTSFRNVQAFSTKWFDIICIFSTLNGNNLPLFIGSIIGLANKYLSSIIFWIFRHLNCSSIKGNYKVFTMIVWLNLKPLIFLSVLVP